MIQLNTNIKKIFAFWTIFFASASLYAVELPPNTMAVMKVSSLNEINSNWKAYLDNASPIEFKISLQDYIIDPFELKSTNGINMDEPIWGIYWRTENEESSYGILYPVSDEEMFREQLPDEDQPDFVINHNYALLTKPGEAAFLETWFDQTDPLDELQNKLQNDQMEVQLWADFEKINQVYKEMLSDLIYDEDQTDETGPPVITESLLELSIQFKDVLLSADISQENIAIHQWIEPLDETAMSEFIQTYKPTDITSLLAAYEPTSVFFGFLNANPPVVQTMMGQFWESLGNYKVRDLQKEAKTASNGSMAYMIEHNHVKDDPYSVRILQGTDSNEDAQSLLQEILDLTTNAKEKYEMGDDLIIKRDAGTVNDQPYSTIKYDWAIDDDPEADPEESPWGKDITLYASPFQELLVMTNGDIEQFINRIQQNLNSDQKTEWPTELDQNALAAARVNLIEVLRGVQLYLNQTSPGFNPLMVIKIPEVITDGVTLRSDVKDKQIHSQLLIPAHEINTLLSVITNEYPIDRESRNSKNRNR